MLLAVEGGGFFSSSASGYSKGLTVLLLGRRKEERPMRVSPWNQYQLVEQEANPEFQLDSKKNLLSRGCASFICFSRASAGIEGSSPPKVGPVHQPDVPQDPTFASEKGQFCINDVGDDTNGRKVCLKSSLKKSSHGSVVVGGADNVHGISDEKGSDSSCCTKRRIQWTDQCGKELIEIREFEVSDADASDDEFDRKGERSCTCVIQ
ncbi:low affinity potassium transport system protein isoform X2 [Tasmannia lanceolata]|uniref:low affinity potassium transport system protein isoform X2 n=1 Tax=Tasmannia lanceolata TaxID=3420 RepID=UPI004063C5EE